MSAPTHARFHADIQALRWIRAYITDHGRHPTLTEVGAQFGLYRHQGAAALYSRLEAGGYLTRVPGSHKVAEFLDPDVVMAKATR